MATRTKGKVSTTKPKDVKELKALFKKFDVNDDGKLSVEEFEKMFQVAGYMPTTDEMDNIMSIIDKNNDRGVDFDEFIDIVQQSGMSRDPKDQAGDLRKAFKKFDKNADGVIDKDEFKYILQLCGETLSEADVDNAWKAADINGDGVIEYEEFVKLWTSV